MKPSLNRNSKCQNVWLAMQNNIVSLSLNIKRVLGHQKSNQVSERMLENVALFYSWSWLSVVGWLLLVQVLCKKI